MVDVPRTGVIHDLGYRPYDGARTGTGAIATALFVSGFRNAFGLGRSGKSKVLPFLLLAFNLLPAVVMVGAMTLFGLDQLPLAYPRYASAFQILLSIFVAAQAPVLFSRDLRHGTIADAQIEMARSGLKLSVPPGLPSDTPVAEQTVPPGTAVAPGTSVAVIPPPAAVPDADSTQILRTPKP